MEEASLKSNIVIELNNVLISNEVSSLNNIISSLQTQLEAKLKRLSIEGKRARELTSEIVATTRDEEKAMLASDEAVSHALTGRHAEDIEQLEKLIKKPYFAKFTLVEEINGKEKTFTYYIGHYGNPECRIIDWRKSPLAKIYYEYGIGDEYSEKIQEKFREGFLEDKTTYNIQEGELLSFRTSDKNYFLDNENKWQTSEKSSGPPRGGIKDVLPLITKEQFSLITEEAETAILIQGVAGSGKTTVALHRLAWLLHENNSELTAKDCGVIVKSKLLATYIKLTLNALEVKDVPVYTFDEWAVKIIASFEKKPCAPSHTIYAMHPSPKGLLLIKHTEEYLKCFEETLNSSFPLNNSTSASSGDYWSVQTNTLLSLSSKAPEVIHRFGFNINEGVAYYKNLRDYYSSQKTLEISPGEIASYVRFIQHKEKSNSPSAPLQFKHTVVDELQDYSLLSLAALINSTSHVKHLTLVGDTAQALSEDHAFIGWERLKTVWNIEHSESAKFFSLKVSHRSSLQIMQLAARIASQTPPTNGRHGRAPIWFHQTGEDTALKSAIQWLYTASEKYPNTATAVLCRDKAEAKYVYNLLEPTFGLSLRDTRHSDFSFDEGIVVTSIDEVKGLEFTNVLIWNPSKKHYPKSDRISKNRLYVAITRAEENLSIISYGKYSNLFPSIYSKLVRGYNYCDEDSSTLQT